MAKLNDPPAPAVESIDALKRRFIRQNRELARVNSTQSQRIRNLETEISRLLAENISLREQAINSAAEAEKWRTSNRLERDVLALKETLSAKLEQVHALVEELGELPAKAARRTSFRRRKSRLDYEAVRSPNTRDWRNRQTASHGLNIESEPQDGRLPAILEDKYYPRRTLERAELQLLVNEADDEKQDTESPDLGPPPVAHFDVADPIAFDSSKSPKRVSGGIVPDDGNSNLPSNLETRRKRRTSSLLQDMSTLQEDPTAHGVETKPTPLLKSGAKRKLDMSQLEENATRDTPVDDFVYQRKAIAPASRLKPSRFTQSRLQQDNDLKETTTTAASPQKSLEPTRQVLASKSTNSPTKRRTQTVSEKGGIGRTDLGVDRTGSLPAISRGRLQRPPRIDLQQVANVEQDPVQNPKTPAASLTEPPSPLTMPTEPLTKPTTSEIAITNSVEDVLNGSIGRGSRRARPAVSYAEPNLRDKMRRPDKKLVGAVEGLSKRDSLRETSIDVPDNELPTSDVHGSRFVDVKVERSEQFEDERWKQLPMADHDPTAKEEAVSPLRDKEKRAVVTIAPERRHKRTFSEAEGTRVTTEGQRDDDKLDRAVHRLSIYDPPTSSPTTDDKDRPPSRSSRESGTMTSARRNDQSGSVGASNTALSTTDVPTRARRHSVQPQQSIVQSIQSQTSNRTISRPNSSISLRDSATIAKDPSSSKLKRSTSAQVLSNGQPHAQVRPQSRTASAAPTPVPNEMVVPTESGTARTIGTRRRSMMV